MLDHFSARANARTIPITAVDGGTYKKWLDAQPKSARNWLTSTGYKADAGKWTLIPGRDSKLAHVVVGTADADDYWSLAGLPKRLPKGRYRLDVDHSTVDPQAAALGWALGSYQFTRYKKAKPLPTLVWPADVDQDAVVRASEATALGRDLINTPAGDMGPEHLAAAAKELADRHGAKFKVIVGDALLKKNFPAIHAVGRASSRAPRLIDFTWGNPRHKKLTFVGKGVCFDTGGLDLKSAAGMKLMKKDMGGAASVLALAHMVMDAGLKVRLRVLVPAVENSVGGDAYRPLDVVPTRKGLNVEIGNTDAEGRVIMCDALAEAETEKPDFLLDFATLTGAARVALGTEVPALFCTHDDLADQILNAGKGVADPLWRMPLHTPYRRHLDSRVADLNNISSVPQGGAITAALYLREFVGRRTRWAHVDTMGYNNSERPGRPAGGDVPGVRAFFEALAERYGYA